jgi:hypothetical protein
MSLGSASGCFAKLPLAQHPERREGPHPLQWLAIVGEGVALIAQDGGLRLIHCGGLHLQFEGPGFDKVNP